MHTSREARFWILFLVSIVILGVNLFWLSPSLMVAENPWIANLVYVATRIGVVFGFATGCAAWAGLARYRILSSGALLTFLEQGMRAVSLYLTSRSQPEAWQDIQPSAVAINLFLAFMTFLPIILVFTWAGLEVGLAWKRWRGPRSSIPAERMSSV